MADQSEPRDLSSKIIHVLNEAQNGLHQHHKLIRQLKNIFESDSPSVKQFFDLFYQPLVNILLVSKREPAAERLIEFVAKFIVVVSPKLQEGEEGEESTDEEEEDDEKLQTNFLHLILSIFINFLEAKDKTVRFRTCQILSKMFTHSTSDSANNIRINSALSNELTDALLERLKDRYHLVRLYATSALAFLQDPSDADCLVTSAMVWVMDHDTNYEVRKCALLNVILSKTSFPSVIERTRDVKDLVRRCAYLTLAEKCSIRHLTIEQRLQIVHDGLKDEVAIVRDACTGGLLRQWCIELEEDLLQLLRRLDVENSPSVAELVLMSLFEDIEDEKLVSSFESNLQREGDGEGGDTLEEGEKGEEGNQLANSHLLPFEELTCELVFYWRCLLKYFHKKQEGRDERGQEHYDRIAPTLTNYCNYLKSFLENQVMLLSNQTLDSQLSLEFIGTQLCGILSCLDFTDEVGKRLLGEMIFQLILNPSLPPEIIPSLLDQQTSIWPQESYRTDKLIELVNEMYHLPSVTIDSTVTNNSSTGNTVCIGNSVSESGESNSGGEMEMSSSIDNLKEVNNDAANLIKCLVLTGEIFKELTLTKLTSPLQTLVETLIIPCIQNENPHVRDLAVFALGLACLLDINLAQRHILLFIQVSQVDHENVQATALKVVFDLLHYFGLEQFNGDQEGSREGDTCSNTQESSDPMEVNDEECNSSNSTGQRFLQILTEFLNGESSLLRDISSEGLCKLLLAGHVISPPLIVRLLLLWYNPSLQGEERLRTVLGQFFTAYSSSKDSTYRTNIAEAFVPLMTALIEAPPTSPLCDIDVKNVAEFVIKFSSPLETDEYSPHDDLSIQVLNYLISINWDDGLEWLRVYCHSLTLMTLSPNNISNIRDVLTLTEQLVKTTKDKQSLKNLKKFQTKLEKLLPQQTQQMVPSPPPSAVDLSKENTTATTDHIVTTPSVIGQRSPLQNHTPNTVIQRGHHRNRDDMNGAVNFSISKSVTSTNKHQKRGTKLRKRKDKNKEEVEQQEGGGEDSNGDSDDSLIGEHSPFVRSTRSKRSANVPLCSSFMEES